MEKRTLTLSELRKVISENAFKILEQDDDLENNMDDINPEPENNLEPKSDIDDSTPIDKGLDTSKSNDDYENLNSMTKKLSSTLLPKKLSDLNMDILRTLSTGRVNKSLTFDKMSEAGKRNEFDYFTTVLASLYKTADESGKSNIRKALFLAYPVYGSSDMRLSSFAKSVARNAKITYDFNSFSQTIDASYYTDTITDSIYEALDYALDNFNPERGKFGSLILNKAANLTIDKLRSKLHKTTFSSAVGGRTTSFDEPLGSSEEERDETKMDRITGDEGEISKTQKDSVKGFADSLKSFIQSKLGAKETLKNYLEFFNLFIEGHNLSEIADMMEVQPGNLRVIKSRMEDFITKFVESGELQQYVKDKTGIKVDFPNNKFSLSVQGTKKGTAEVEPVEIFNVTGVNPKTGEPTGEWVAITPDTHDSETTWFDKYGDLVTWKNKEENVEPNSEISGDENNLTESLNKFIQKEILKSK